MSQRDILNIEQEWREPNLLVTPTEAQEKERREDIKIKRLVLLKAVLGELLCTFLFIFIVCATQLNFNRLENTRTDPVIGAIATGFAAVALIYSFADVSGANFNPAVTFATFVTGKVSFFKFLLYVLAQLTGASLAAVLLLIAFPEWNGPKVIAIRRGTDTSLGHVFIMEFILTFILVYVIFATAFDTVETPQKVDLNYEELTGADDTASVATSTRGRPNKPKPRLTIYTTSGNTKGGFAPIAIGFTLGFLNFIGGTVSGGAFNPARAFGPGLIGWVWKDQWVYWLADMLGAGLAGYIHMFFATQKQDPLVFFRPLMDFYNRRKEIQRLRDHQV